MNLKTAARRLGVHYQTAYRWVRSGQLVAVKVGAGYEISEAALQRFQAQRAALERVPEESPAPVAAAPADRQAALDLLDAMCEQVTTDERAVLQRAASVTASVLGDAVAVYLPGAAGPEAVAFDHADPARAVVLGTMVRQAIEGEPSFAPRSPRDGPLLVPQVAQRDVRKGLRPEFHQFLTVLGFYSAISVPLPLRDGHAGLVFAARDAPGRPYTLDDLALVEQVVARIALAARRAEQGRASWATRADLVRSLRERAAGGTLGARGEALVASVADDEAAVVVGPDRLVRAASKGFATLLETSVADLDGADLAKCFLRDPALPAVFDRMLAGELDYCSLVATVPRVRRRVDLHGGIVRLADATPACVVFAAHERPELAT
ncbi:MAG: hypothetical protein KatS3mg009_2789 [Acidimicrobiia bacterium]|nr:MAG: hypothetical protein KatS3mg009_2789 [Acidimicrobiia bacterium]